jgi:hypothetical protein
VVLDTHVFEQGCLSGKKKNNDTGSVVPTTYAPTVPVKAVHLIRSPFDNVVSRMHLELRRHKREETFKSNDKGGFDAWCQYMEDKFAPQEARTELLSEEVKELFVGVPCHADWFRYVQWHNLAIQVIEQRNLPVHVLYYENYTMNYNATMDDLFEFLQLEKKATPIQFVAGKTYMSFYSDEQVRAARKLVHALASPMTWDLVKHYFDSV